MSTYLKCDQIKGNVTSPPYQEHVKLDSVEFSIDRAQQAAQFEASDQGLRRPVMGGFIITKPVDISSPSLFKEATAGKSIASIEIKFSTISKDKIDTFMSYTLSDCYISNYNMTSDGSGEPMESFTILYNKIMYKFIEFDKNDKPTRPITVGYDLRKGMAL